MRDASADRRSLMRALVIVAVILVAGSAWLIRLTAFGYAPWSDSALYIDAGLHLGHGDGLVSTMGFPIAPTPARPFPFVFHPVGGIAPYAIAALGTGVDRFAIAFAASLALYLSAVVLLWQITARVTGHLFSAAAAAIVFALDPAVLAEATGVSTTLPLLVTMGALTVFVARRWPPSSIGWAFGIGISVALTHLVRIADPPLIAAAALLLLVGRQWRSLSGLLLGYGITSIALLPALVPSSVASASLLADTPGFEGFSPAQLDTPSVIVILTSHIRDVMQKTGANLVHNVAHAPADVNAYAVVAALIGVTVAALRGDRRMALVIAAVASTTIFASVFFVGTRYLIHLLFPLLLAGTVLLDRWTDRRVPIALILVGLAVAVFAADSRATLATRSDRERAITSLVQAADLVRSSTSPAETVLTDHPAEIGLYSGRWSFNIPAHPSDLPRLEERIGTIHVMVLRRGQVENRVMYPDPAWRAVFASDRFSELRWVATVGEGPSEVRIYRRP